MGVKEAMAEFVGTQAAWRLARNLAASLEEAASVAKERLDRAESARNDASKQLTRAIEADALGFSSLEGVGLRPDDLRALAHGEDDLLNEAVMLIHAIDGSTLVRDFWGRDATAPAKAPEQPA